MAISLFSDSWYRVAAMKPRLRTHVDVHHIYYRGVEWFVLEDNSTGQYYRFSPEAYAIIGRMDGRRTMDDIYYSCCNQLGDDMPTQDEVIRLLSTLHRSSVMQSDFPPDVAELHERHLAKQRAFWSEYMMSPIAWRIPLIDPDRFLDRTFPYVRPFLGWLGALLFLVTVGMALLAASVYWTDITVNIADKVFSLQNLFLVILVYPVMKAIHELGHAYCVKLHGGEVHQMGIFFIVFMPIPYVDASASLAFPNKWDRMLVSAAGILVEVFLAAVATLVWVTVEEGAIRAVAYNAMVLGAVSTLLFNGNPLLRFDGHHVLSDFIEIPNLRTRGMRYMAYIFQTYLLGVQGMESPATTTGEAVWLAVFAVASFFYRMYIVIRIITFVATKAFIVGILMAIWASIGLLVLPAVKSLKHLAWLTYMQPARGRILPTAALLVAGVTYLFFGVEIPTYTQTEGVLWAPENARVHASTSGFIRGVLVASGSRVRRGQPLIACTDPALGTRVQTLEAQLREFQAREREQQITDPIQGKILGDEIDRIEEELDLAREKERHLTILSPLDGVFLLPDERDWIGRYASRGTSIGYVVDFERVVVRAVVTQDDIDRVRSGTCGVEAVLASDWLNPVPARILQEMPAASKELPSLALSINGGGPIALDPTSQTPEPRAFETLFQFELELIDRPVHTIGERVHVRFEHPPESLARRAYRNVRRLLLRQFTV